MTGKQILMFAGDFVEDYEISRPPQLDGTIHSNRYMRRGRSLACEPLKYQ